MTIKELNEALDSMHKMMPFGDEDTEIMIFPRMDASYICLKTYKDGIEVSLERKIERRTKNESNA